MSETPASTLMNETTPTTPDPVSSTTPPTEPAAPPTSTPPVAEPPKTPAGAPDTYAEFTAPEGITLDKDAIASSSALFKELNLTQEQAQKVINAQAQREAELVKAANEAYANQRRQWRTDTLTQMGGEARMKSEVLPVVSRALDTLGADTKAAFQQAMDFTGAGDNPAFVKVFYEFAKKINEGTAVRGGGPAPDQRQPARPALAQSMYPSPAPQRG